MFDFKVLKCFQASLDIRLEISVVSTCVNLNKMSAHIKNLKIKISQYTDFG